MPGYSEEQLRGQIGIARRAIPARAVFGAADFGQGGGGAGWGGVITRVVAGPTLPPTL